MSPSLSIITLKTVRKNVKLKRLTFYQTERRQTVAIDCLWVVFIDVLVKVPKLKAKLSTHVVYLMLDR